MLRIENITISYGKTTLLKDFTLNIPPQEVVCIAGESGCGKTTLLKAIMGFVDYSGNITIDNTPLTPKTVDQIRRNIAYVPQELSLPHETIEEMIRIPFELKANRATPYSRQRILSEWEKLELPPSLLNMRTTEVSGGQRQRIMLSLAGLLNKKLLLADEPTSALDPDTATHVAQYFKTLAHERGMTILTASHSPQLTSQADKTITLKKETL